MGLIALLAGSVYHNISLKNELTAQREIYEKQLKQQRELKNTIEKMKSKEYIEEMARKKLKYIKPGEKVYGD